MLDIEEVKAGDVIKYIGDSIAFGGSYIVFTAESTYHDVTMIPEDEKGKLMIIEFMKNDVPMFFTLDTLNAEEWERV